MVANLTGRVVRETLRNVGIEQTLLREVSPGFYPARADTSEKAHLGPGGVSWKSEGSTARSLSVRRSG